MGGTGAAYVFENQSLAGWTQAAKLTASDGAAGDRFGQSVALDGDAIAVSAPWHGIGGSAKVGATYIFKKQSSSWMEVYKFSDSTAAAESQIGFGLAISGDTLAVGTPDLSKLYLLDPYPLDPNAFPGYVALEGRKFTFVGTGKCQDGSEQLYSNVMLTMASNDPYSATSQVTDCSSSCVGFGTDGFVGFTSAQKATNVGLHFCFCYYDRNAILPPDAKTSTNFASFSAGEGPVEGSKGGLAGHGVCYKYSPRLPSASPTSSPTDSPTSPTVSPTTSPTETSYFSASTPWTPALWASTTIMPMKIASACTPGTESRVPTMRMG
ncbi:hypothetical protein THAOC_28992 [Thalassiosira oceanica]|uniref:Uncharacterized protein n=1 Tax=Thalassiosira oceanica TaxID=159749 RepID=K0RHP1_THAOC|nr:hypothetical protein THAOC_28992 [Thalassiosira oceanica]|eukprot:EJK51804.1 hypothetical protein THAOC_28992 [Thalassiosira oceanica]